MKTYLRYACWLLPFFFVACSKKDTVKPPVVIPDSSAVYHAQLKFPLTRYGAGALQDSLVVIPVTKARPNLGYTYSIVSSGGLKTGEKAVQGSGAADNNGNFTFDFTHFLQVYNDGTLTLTINFSDSTHAVASTLKDQYNIRTYADLHGMQYDLLGSYLQAEDIAFPALADLQKLNRYGAVVQGDFRGTYDGNGHKLTSVSFYSDVQERPGGNELGLFQNIDTPGVVKNVLLQFSADGAKSTTNGYSGGIASTSSSTIVGCYVQGNISVTGTLLCYAGGIVGSNYGNVIACGYSGTLIAQTAGMTGGIAAYQGGENGKIDACYANFITTTNIGGGISGDVKVDAFHQTTISNSYANVTVTSASNFGAIRLQKNPGFTAQEANLIVNCFSNITTVQPGTTVYSSVSELTADVTAFTLSSFPSQLTAPADNKPFKANTATGQPPLLWWQ